MAILPNARHERFAQELAKGCSATEAYELAGYKPSQPSAARLLSNVIVSARVDELLSVGAKLAEFTAQSHLDRVGLRGGDDGGNCASGWFVAYVKMNSGLDRSD